MTSAKTTSFWSTRLDKIRLVGLRVADERQNLPFTYTMESDETLHFYDSLSRPERILDAPLTEDPILLVGSPNCG